MKPAEIKRRVEAGTTSPAPGLFVRPGYERDGSIELLTPLDDPDPQLSKKFSFVIVPDPEALLRSIKRAAAYAKRMQREKGAAA